MNNLVQEKIDQYLLEQLSPAEKQAFEKQMTQDAQLAREVAAQREAIALTEGMGDRIIRARIKSAGEKAMAQMAEEKEGVESSETTASLTDTAPNKGNRKWLWALLLLLAGALALYWILGSGAPSDPGKIYATYYERPSLSFVDRGSENEFAEANRAYANKNYAEALALFEQRAPQNTEAKIALAKAICQMQLNQHDAAIALLSPFTNDSLYANQCQWYLALCWFEKENTTKAKAQLNKILQSKDAFKKIEAQEILTNLK